MSDSFKCTICLKWKSSVLKSYMEQPYVCAPCRRVI